MAKYRILETERLYLRELCQEDFPALCMILQDEKTMYAYEGAFSDTEVQQWLDRQLSRYREFGFGLWAAVRRDNDEVIGQCGLTMQPWKEHVCSSDLNRLSVSAPVLAPGVRHGSRKRV